MAVDVIEQYPDDYSIVRFLDKEGLLRTLEDHRGDRYENQIITYHPETGVLLSNQNLNTVLVSCFGHDMEDIYTALPWDTFKVFVLYLWRS